MVPENVQVFPFQDPLLEKLALVSRADSSISLATREIMTLIRRLVVGPQLGRAGLRGKAKGASASPPDHKDN